VVDFSELEIFPESWNGRPLPIDHPKDAEGLAASASQPSVIETSVVGQFFHVFADKATKSLKGELWIDNEKAQTVPGGQESIDKLVAGESLEVSTAYFTFIDNIPGEWVFAAKNGDHLYQREVDYTRVADYYKGKPDENYVSHVWTDTLTPEDLVVERDALEHEVRDYLGIPFNPSASAQLYEHSMGQTALPARILRTSSVHTIPLSA